MLSQTDIHHDTQADEIYRRGFQREAPMIPSTKRSLANKIFKPLARLNKNAAQYTQPYRSRSEFLTDLAQPLYGLVNILKGGLTLLLNPIICVSQIHSDLRFNNRSYITMLGTNLLRSILIICQGVIEIASAPISYAIKIPLRGLVLTPLNSLFNFLRATREKRQQKIVEERKKLHHIEIEQQLENKNIKPISSLHTVDRNGHVNIVGKDSMMHILSFLEPKDLPKTARISTEYYLVHKEHIQLNNIDVPQPIKEFYTIGECYVAISSLKNMYFTREKIPLNELNSMSTLFQSEHIKLFKTEKEAIKYARKLLSGNCGENTLAIPPICKVNYLRNDIFPDTEMKKLSTGEQYFQRPKKDIKVIERKPVTEDENSEFVLNEDKDKFIRTRCR